MIGWIILAILVALVLLAFVVRLGVRFCYAADGPWVKIKLGPKLVPVYPAPPVDPEKKARQAAKKEAKRAKKEAKKAAKPPKEPVKRPIGGLLELVWDALPLLGEATQRLRRKLVIEQLTLHLIWAEEDPADAGMHYGQGYAVIEALLAWVQANYILKERDVALDVDFLSEEPRIYIEAALSMTLAQLISFGCGMGWSVFRVLRAHWDTIRPAKAAKAVKHESKPADTAAETQKGEP